MPSKSIRWFATSLLAAACTAHAAGITVEDTRKGPVRAESRNTGGGAELILSERRLSPRLIERIGTRLAELPAPASGDTVLKLGKAEVVLFVEGALAVPGVVSGSGYVREAAQRQWPDELTELRESGSSGRREYRVIIEGEIGGRPIRAEAKETFLGPENSARLNRVVDAALDQLAEQLSAG